MSTTSTFQQLVALPMEQYTQLMSVANMQQPPLQQKLKQVQHDFTVSANAPPAALTESSPPNPYDRMIRQGMLLEQVKRLKDQMRASVATGTPKPYRNRALALYNQIAPVTQFNEQGELVIPDGVGGEGRAVAGSRAEDLIQHAVRDRRKHFTPTGWPEFVHELLQHNIPRMMLNRPTIDELQVLAKKKPLLPPPPRPPSSATPTPSPKRRVTRAELKRKRSRNRLRAGFLSTFEA